MDNRLRRSALYLPGSNLRAIGKAREIPADAIIFDLEDSVVPDAKAMARDQVMAAVSAGGYGRRERVIRINALTTPWGRGDLRAAVSARPDAILVPKVSDPKDLAEIQNALSAAGVPIGIWAMIETPLAMGNLFPIAAARSDIAPALSVFVVGTNDLAKEMRLRAKPGRASLMPLLTNCVAAARAYGLEIIDGVFNTLDDEDGFSAECDQGRDLGMDGKSLIHPNQVRTCNRIFSPAAEEIAFARRIVSAFEEAQNRHAGVLQVDGQMVERLHLEMARRVLAAASLAEGD